MTEANSNGHSPAAAADFSLVLATIEKEILEGRDTGRCRRILTNRALWRKLSDDEQLRWARMAQMAGEIEVALDVFASLNQRSPDCADGWLEHAALLRLLGKHRELASLAARAKGHVPTEETNRWAGESGQAASRPTEQELDAVAGPFEALARRRRLLDRFLELFAGRSDTFARQWANRSEDRQGYVPVRRSLGHPEIEEHLKGLKTYGIYLLDEDGNTRTAVIDADLKPAFRRGNLSADDRRAFGREKRYLFERVKSLSVDSGLHPLVEFSGGKGYHFWYFFESPQPPARVRSAVERVRQALAPDLSVFGLEVFPKQDHLSGKGLGNLVKLPLGVHRLSGKRSFFLECSSRDPDRQLAFLENASWSDPKKGLDAGGGEPSERVFVHPKYKQWAEKYPELFQLENACAPLAQVFAACRKGVALSLREEKVLYQSLGFLPRAKTLIHRLVSDLPEYNPHMVDYRLSQIRGTPLGCRRIHSLMSYGGDYCRFENAKGYDHPLRHLADWTEDPSPKAEKVENLTAALDNLQAAIVQTQRFLKT